MKSQKPGKGDALRKERGAFCLLFVAAWTKSKASGGTQTAGFDFKNKEEVQQMNHLSPSRQQSLAERCQQPEACHSSGLSSALVAKHPFSGCPAFGHDR
ncbi:MAG: hypothetical protein AB1Z50_03020, partial [Desulfuromonadales bacterium]